MHTHQHGSRQRYPRAQRLSRSADIAAVKQTGRRVKAEQMDVRVAPSPLVFARVGIIVPKHKRSIVERNRLRRRLRELVRIKILPTLSTKNVALDILIRTFPSTYEMTFDELARAVDRLVPRLA